MAQQSPGAGRKIELDTEIYCRSDYEIAPGNDPNCDHDYPPDPVVDEHRDICATWQCTRCGCRITFYVWE